MALPLICLRRGGRGVEDVGVGMVGGLFQGLDQVLPVFWVYTPQGPFADTLKHKEGHNTLDIQTPP